MYAPGGGFHCLKCQARKTPRLTVRWPIISMPLPEGSGIDISVDYFGPLPVTPRGNTWLWIRADSSDSIIGIEKYVFSTVQTIK